MSEPIEYMTIITCANGIEVDISPHSYKSGGYMREPEKVFVFTSIEAFSDWVCKQTWGFAPVEVKQ